MPHAKAFSDEHPASLAQTEYLVWQGEWEGEEEGRVQVEIEVCREYWMYVYVVEVEGERKNYMYM